MKILPLALLLCLNHLLMKAQQGDTVEINRNKNHQITFIRFRPNATRKLADGAAFLSKVLKMGTIYFGYERNSN